MLGEQRHRIRQEQIIAKKEKLLADKEKSENNTLKERLTNEMWMRLQAESRADVRGLFGESLTDCITSIICPSIRGPLSLPSQCGSQSRLAQV